MHFSLFGKAITRANKIQVLEPQLFTASCLANKLLNNRFAILHGLGSGGSGLVYLATDLLLGRQVAIKFINPDIDDDAEEWEQRLMREAVIMCSLEHAGIVKCFALTKLDNDADLVPGAKSGTTFVVMDYIESTPLAIQKSEIKSVNTIIEIAQQICSALSYAHGRGLVHRDLSANNILIKQDGASLQAKIIDFGLAHLMPKNDITTNSQRLTQTGCVVGSIHYMSPEQCSGASIDKRTDVYALGCILYEMLTGMPPFHSESPIDTMYKHLHEAAPPPKPRTDLCGDATSLIAVILRCLAKNKEERYQSCEEVASALQSEGPSHRTPTPRLNRDNQGKGPLGLLAVIFVIVAFAINFGDFDDVLARAVRSVADNNSILCLAKGIEALGLHRKARVMALSTTIQGRESFLEHCSTTLTTLQSGVLSEEESNAVFYRLLKEMNEHFGNDRTAVLSAQDYSVIRKLSDYARTLRRTSKESIIGLSHLYSTIKSKHFEEPATESDLLEATLELDRIYRHSHSSSAPLKPDGTISLITCLSISEQKCGKTKHATELLLEASRMIEQEGPTIPNMKQQVASSVLSTLSYAYVSTEIKEGLHDFSRFVRKVESNRSLEAKDGLSIHKNLATAFVKQRDFDEARVETAESLEYLRKHQALLKADNGELDSLLSSLLSIEFNRQDFQSMQNIVRNPGIVSGIPLTGVRYWQWRANLMSSNLCDGITEELAKKQNKNVRELVTLHSSDLQHCPDDCKGYTALQLARAALLLAKGKMTEESESLFRLASALIVSADATRTNAGVCVAYSHAMGLLEAGKIQEARRALPMQDMTFPDPLLPDYARSMQDQLQHLRKQ